MQLTVQLFGLLKEALGEAITLTLSPPCTVARLLDVFIAQYPQYGPLRESLLVAVDECYAQPHQALHPSQQLALFPPLGGGSDHTRGTKAKLDQTDTSKNKLTTTHYLSEQPIVLEQLLAEVCAHQETSHANSQTASASTSIAQIGGVSTFLGVVRGWHQGQRVCYLEYQAHQSMALRQLEELGAELQEHWGVKRVIFAHRLGRVAVGEVSLAVVVGTEHRKEAMAACQYAVERIKSKLPVWKKEVLVDGEQWVDNSSSLKTNHKQQPNKK